jgi:hypothetical protein
MVVHEILTLSGSEREILKRHTAIKTGDELEENLGEMMTVAATLRG